MIEMKCKRCKGSGDVNVLCRYAPEAFYDLFPCDDCEGTGVVMQRTLREDILCDAQEWSAHCYVSARIMFDLLFGGDAGRLETARFQERAAYQSRKVRALLGIEGF